VLGKLLDLTMNMADALKVLAEELLKVLARLLEALKRGKLEAARVYAEQAKRFTEGLAA